MNIACSAGRDLVTDNFATQNFSDHGSPTSTPYGRLVYRLRLSNPALISQIQQNESDALVLVSAGRLGQEPCTAKPCLTESLYFTRPRRRVSCTHYPVYGLRLFTIDSPWSEDV